MKSFIVLWTSQEWTPNRQIYLENLPRNLPRKNGDKQIAANLELSHIVFFSLLSHVGLCCWNALPLDCSDDFESCHEKMTIGHSLTFSNMISHS